LLGGISDANPVLCKLKFFMKCFWANDALIENAASTHNKKEYIRNRFMASLYNGD
jgi:hypothetical protein